MKVRQSQYHYIRIDLHLVTCKLILKRFSNKCANAGS